MQCKKRQGEARWGKTKQDIKTMQDNTIRHKEGRGKAMQYNAYQYEAMQTHAKQPEPIRGSA